MLGLSALMLAATGTSQAQGFTITSTPTFASTNVASTSAAGNVVVKTTGTTTITSISVPNSASGSPQFNYVSISGCTIGTAAPNNTTCTISVTFSPAYPGVQSAPLVIAYTGGTFNVGLVGTGLAPQAVLLPGVLSTVVNTAGVAGTVGQGNNGQATAAGLKLPRDIGFDYAGNYYIGDIGNGAGTTDTAEIRKVTTATGVISQFAGAGSGTTAYSSTSTGVAATSVAFNYATGVVFDSAGNAYIPDFFHNVVARVDAVTGDIKVYAGQYGVIGSAGDGGLATAAKLSGPAALAIDPVTGNLFIVDPSNNDVREVDAATGVITTVVGVSGSNAGCATTTAACGDGGLATAAQLNQPNGIAVDASGNIYISDSQDNRIRLVTKSTGKISTIAGTGTAGYSGDGGAATSAKLSSPFQIALDPAGDLYIADTNNNAVRLYIAATQNIVTIAGNGTACTTLPGSTCGDGGLSNVSSLNGPTGVGVDPFGNVYIVESGGNRVRKVTTNTTAANTFPTEPIGTTSTTQTETLLNIGNATLTYTSPLSPNSDALVTTTDPNAAVSTSGAFAQTNATTCGPIYSTTTTGTTLASGTPCVFVVSFTPNTVAGNYTGNLVETDNSLYNTASTQTITLAGTGTKLTPTVTLNSNNNPSYLGQSVTFTATVTSPNSSAVAPTDNVAFTYTTTAAPATPVTITGSPVTVTTSVAGVTTAVISTSSLPLGTDSVTAVYSGDGAYNTASSSAFAQAVQLVSGAADTVSAATTTTTLGTADQLTFAIPVITGAAVPTGSVAFTAGATSLGTSNWPATPVTGTCPSGSGLCYLLNPPSAPTNIPLGSPTTVTATFTPTGASGYAAPTTAPTIGVTVTLDPDNITVTSPTSPDNVAYGSGTVPITASSTSGQPIAYSTTTPGVCSVSTTGVVTTLSTGVCTVNLNQPAAGNYAAAGQQTVTINVGAGANTITFPALSNAVIGATPPVPAATATSGVAPTYTSTTMSVCTVTSAGVITDLTPGTCTITAAQGATGNYAAATSVSQSFQVTPLTDNITVTSPASPDNVSYTNGGTVPITASSTSGQPLTYSTTSPACTVSSTGVITEVSTGICMVSVSQPAAGNYAAATTQTVTVSIGAGTNTITFPALANTPAGATAPVPAATATSGVAPTYTSSTMSVCTVTSAGVITDLTPGTCTITAAQGATGNYAAATSVSQSYQVTPLTDTITIPGTVPASAIVGGTVSIGATTTSGVTPVYTSTTPAICSVSATGVVTTLAIGGCSVTVSQAAAGNYAAATPQTVTIAVNGQSQTIQNFGTALTATYGGTAPMLAATATSGLTPTYSATGTACSVTSAGAVTILAAGSCQITASQAGNSTFAAATPVSETLTVNPAADVITIPGTIPANATVGAAVPINATTTSGVAPTYTSTTPAVCSVSTAGVVTALTSGSCSVSVTQAAAGNYAAAAPQTVTIALSGEAQTIQNFGVPIMATYGGAAPVLGATATSGLAPTYAATGAACSVTSSGAVTMLAIGTCQITASQAGNSTYAAATPVSETLTVNPEADVITIPGTVPTTATVGATVPIGATTTSGVTPTYTSTTPATCSVSATGVVTALASGTCSVSVTQPAAGNFAAAAPQTVTIALNGQAQAIQNFGTPITATYGGTTPVLAATATSGLAPTYTSTGPACSVSSAGAVTILAAGSCQITASQPGNSTYAAATPVSETLTVNPEADVITIPPTVPTTATVGSTTPIGATTTSGVAPTYTSTTPAVCSVSSTGVITTLSAGPCSVSVTQPAAGNFAAAPPQTVTLSVSTQSQTIQNFGTPITVTYGGAAPVLAATATSGLTPTYASTGAACSVTNTGAVTILAVGTCQITASQAGNATYAAATPVPETLTVNPAADVITIPPTVPTTTTVGSNTPIGATTTSGVTPTYTSTTPGVCSVSATGVVTDLASGSCSVTVSQAAAGNYAAAAPQTVTIAVSGQSQTIQNFGTPITASYGGAAPVLAATATSGLTPTYASTGSACSVTSAGAVTILAVGTCQITASQTGNSTYAAATPVVETLTVNPAADVITIPPTVPSTTTVGANVTIGATTTSGLPPTYTSTTPAFCSVSSTGVITATAIGTCSVSVTQPAAGNYAAATPQTVTLTVSGATNTITFPALPNTPFTSTPPVTAATATSGQPVTYSTATAACSVTPSGVVTFNSIGTCSITANQAATGTYAAATPVTQSFLITPGVDAIVVPPTVPANSAPGTTVPIGATSTSGGPITYVSATPTVCTVTSPGGVVTVVAAGTCTITLSQPAAGNFAAAPIQTVTLNAFDFTITANSPTSQTVVPSSVVVYTYALAPLGGHYPGANVTYTVTGLPPGATYTLTPTSGTVTQAAGSQTLTLTITTAQAIAMNRIRQTAPWTLALLLPFFLRRKLRRKLAQSLMLIFLLGAAALTVTGCADPNGFFGQPIANYTITVTATSGGVTHSAAPVNLQVQ